MPGPPFEKGKSGNPGGRPKVLAELRQLARSYAPEAIKELARLATKARSETARIAAIRELLDRGFGKSTQFIADHEKPKTDLLKIVFVEPDPRPDDPLLCTDLPKAHSADQHAPFHRGR